MGNCMMPLPEVAGRLLVDARSASTINWGVKLGGPVHSFPPFLFFFGAPLFPLFFCSGGNRKHPKLPKDSKNRQMPNKERPFFRQDDIPPPPHHRDFPIDLQQRWSINRKIGYCQCTYYLIVRALTIADCGFFSSRRC